MYETINEALRSSFYRDPAVEGKIAEYEQRVLDDKISSFVAAKELLDLCEENQLPISEVMRQRECILGEVPRDAVDHRMAKAWEIMHASATQPLKKPIKSMGGLIGGEAKKLETHYNKKKTSAAMCCRRP